MTDIITIIARPLIGAAIGYITNDIAIRMLFRPRRAKYIFGVKIPFTPGLIPKEKSRIAASIGNAISKNLMDTETVRKTLLAQDMLDKISGGVDAYIDSQKSNSETLEQYLSHYLKADDIAYMKTSVCADFSVQIHSALSNSRLGDEVAHIAIGHVMAKVKNGMLGMFGADQFLGMVAAPAENLLAKNINEMLADHSQEMVRTLVGDQIDSLLKVPMKNLFAGRGEMIAKFKESLLSLYRTIVTTQLPKILEAVDISKIVESRINEMDVKETEKLIFDVMNKELKAIVWLGALLGFLMGCINLLL